MSGHFCSASVLHDLVIVTLLNRAVWQDAESWPKCSLMQALSRLSPGLTSAHSCLMSAAQACRAAPGWAIAGVGASRRNDSASPVKRPLTPTLSSQAGRGKKCGGYDRASSLGQPGLAQSGEIGRLGQRADFGIVEPVRFLDGGEARIHFAQSLGFCELRSSTVGLVLQSVTGREIGVNKGQPLILAARLFQ